MDRSGGRVMKSKGGKRDALASCGKKERLGR